MTPRVWLDRGFFAFMGFGLAILLGVPVRDAREAHAYASGYCAALDLPAAKVDGAWVCVDATTPVDIQP